MKLIIAIIANADANALIDALVKEKLSVTKLATSGGFLKRKNATLLIGVSGDEVEHVVSIIKKNCKSRKEIVPMMSRAGDGSLYDAQNITVPVGGATIFVVDVEQFERV
ncbi:MAG: cyclic-di-AMP receptor [Bacilli bacterium]|nr:cyclic-di-AMP receptor [Bacilli bacterium]MDD3422193.1 cyclic-di-AMP receptor [Bacilli bacterium]